VRLAQRELFQAGCFLPLGEAATKLAWGRGTAFDRELIGRALGELAASAILVGEAPSNEARVAAMVHLARSALGKDGTTASPEKIAEAEALILTARTVSVLPEDFAFELPSLVSVDLAEADECLGDGAPGAARGRLDAALEKLPGEAALELLSWSAPQSVPGAPALPMKVEPLRRSDEELLALLHPEQPVLRQATHVTRVALNGETIVYDWFHVAEGAAAWRPSTDLQEVRISTAPQARDLQSILQAMTAARREVATDPLGRPRALLKGPEGEVISVPLVCGDPGLKFDDASLMLHVERDVLALVGAQRIQLIEKTFDPEEMPTASWLHFLHGLFAERPEAWTSPSGYGSRAVGLSWDELLKSVSGLRTRMSEVAGSEGSSLDELKKRRDVLANKTSRFRWKQNEIDAQRETVVAGVAQSALDLERAEGLAGALEGFEQLATLPAPLRFSHLRVATGLIDPDHVRLAGEDFEAAHREMVQRSVAQPSHLWALLLDDSDAGPQYWLAELPEGLSSPQGIWNLHPGLPVVAVCQDAAWQNHDGRTNLVT
jgi:hypothetical protein